MNRILRFLIDGPENPARSVLLVRLAVGLIFATQGLLKFTDPKMGVERFAKIGFPQPALLAHFAGTFEIACGVMVLLGFLTRFAVIPLLVVISTAIVSTKIPELSRPGQGLWYMVSDARTDFAMLCCLLFLLVCGPGPLSFDFKNKQS